MTRIDDPIVLNGIRLKNRLAMAPVTTGYAGTDGRVTDRVLDFYDRRSRDVGLVVVEATAVRADGRLVPGSVGLWEDAQVPGMTRLAALLHERGAVAVVQLNHAGARSADRSGDFLGASPSGVVLREGLAAFALDEARIDRLVSDFEAAAARAAAAGFDGVEVHGAHFYLLSQFLSPLTNRREDRYGGDAAGRATFPAEVVRAVRRRLGPKALVLFRMNGVERIDGGQTLEDAATAARIVAAAGVDVLDVSLAAQAAWKEVPGGRALVASSALPKGEAAGSALPLAAEIRRATGLPVVGVGKLGSPEAATRALAEGAADLVALGRQLVADPDSAGKILAGEGDAIVPCVECFQCFACIGRGEPMRCPVDETGPAA